VEDLEAVGGYWEGRFLALEGGSGEVDDRGGRG